MTVDKLNRNRPAQASRGTASPARAEQPIQGSTPAMQQKLADVQFSAESNPRYAAAHLGARGRSLEEPSLTRRGRARQTMAPKSTTLDEFIADGAVSYYDGHPHALVGGFGSDGRRTLVDDTITQQPFEQPVVAADGHYYEAAVLRKLLSNGEAVSPYTGTSLVGVGEVLQNPLTGKLVNPQFLGSKYDARPFVGMGHNRLQTEMLPLEPLEPKVIDPERDLIKDVDGEVLTERMAGWKQEESDLKSYYKSRIEQEESRRSYVQFQKELADWKRLPRKERKRQPKPQYREKRQNLSAADYDAFQERYINHIHTKRRGRMLDAVDNGHAAEFAKFHSASMPMMDGTIARMHRPEGDMLGELVRERVEASSSEKSGSKGVFSAVRNLFRRRR